MRSSDSLHCDFGTLPYCISPPTGNHRLPDKIQPRESHDSTVPSGCIKLVLFIANGSAVAGDSFVGGIAGLLSTKNKTIINISDYSNLWADHKRSKFEQISFEKKDGVLLPIKINIHFDGRVFKLEEN